MKLNNSALDQLSPEVSVPAYERSNLRQGIVHIGVGGFHRAHEAVYTHQLLQAGGSPDWSICGVGLREGDRAMHQVLSAQDHLYTLIELGADRTNTLSVIGSITGFMFAPEEQDAVIEKMVSSEVKIVSLTITEGGYNVDDNTGRFNENHPDVLHDLENPQQPRTVFGYLTEALCRRRERNLPPFTVLSCDNLPENGQVARSALLSFARLRDADLAGWIGEKVSFPSSMVDRITPGTHDKHRQWLKDNYDLEDGWPVICEPFYQWVLEDDFCNGRPEWEAVGVQFTDDVAPYERMKIRLLNASHSAMAYLGYLSGYRYTHEVMADDRFSRFIRSFMDEDVTPILGEISGIDVPAYKQTLVERFSNPQMGDELARLCMDGSSKIPKFLVPTVQTLVNEGRPLSRVAMIIASWALYLRGKDEKGQPHEINDPMAPRLQAAVEDRANLTPELLGMADLFGTTLASSSDFEEAFDRALDKLETKGVFAALSES
ncbi:MULTISPECIES: mannitol dehydrogenase family protein [Marinobacter]|uniref:mannitol dehydrogenase family protein n=1 Tax=Marinobacter TaxID=2742 RepID=UPI000948A118|nr:mannitol dehydrogenase family protein [Marinobacter sp. C18]OLF84840.1 mannitol dehydrogenase [Marinobacter sp. C18]